MKHTSTTQLINATTPKITGEIFFESPRLPLFQPRNKPTRARAGGNSNPVSRRPTLQSAATLHRTGGNICTRKYRETVSNSRLLTKPGVYAHDRVNEVKSRGGATV